MKECQCVYVETSDGKRIPLLEATTEQLYSLDRVIVNHKGEERRIRIAELKALWEQHQLLGIPMNGAKKKV
jgi:hypothetical protein